MKMCKRQQVTSLLSCESVTRRVFLEVETFVLLLLLNSFTLLPSLHGALECRYKYRL